MALEPLGVVTLMSTVPEPEGDMALTEVGEMTVTSVAGAEPKSTALVPVSPVPVMTTVVPPASGPALGLMASTVGAPS